MIIYSGTKETFRRDAINGIIANRLDGLFAELGIGREGYAEFRSWKASLPRMALVMDDDRIDKQVQVALEYRIPLTSKRVDFMVGGNDGSHDNVVIVELKQWENCKATSRENVVNAFTGGANRDVAHPSQQAYSYAKLIENFNETVRKQHIGMIPCAYLHNFGEEGRKELCHSKYSEALAAAPCFLKEDGTKLADFIAKHAGRPSNKKLFDIIENGKLKPSQALQDTIGRVLNGNEAFEMIDEQQVAYATVLKLVKDAAKDSGKHTIIVQGGPGTGKSVIAINLLSKIINQGMSCVYVTKNGAPRYTFSQQLIGGRFTLGYLRGLFKGSGSFYEVPADTYQCILTDEAHRLNLKSGLYGNLGENQVKEIINACRISVFFLDEDQIVTTKDIGTVAEIKKQAEALGSTVHCGDSLKLTSQFRCNGSDGYIAFLDDILGIRETANQDFSDYDYDIRIFDDASAMREALRPLNANNKARMIAGYCYKWVSKNDKSLTDINLPGGFAAQWNFNTNEFATDPDSFEQVGCIHSTQGLEFDYVGIIIGRDMICQDGQVVTDYTKRDSRDKTIQGIRTSKNYALADRIIRNTYKTLLSRGQKGCFIYCEDKALSEYLKAKIAAAQAAREKWLGKYAREQQEEVSAAEIVSLADTVPDNMVLIPLVGEIAAGHEHFMEEEIEEWIPTPRWQVNSTAEGKYFYLRVSGDSMTGVGIFDGDKVLIRRMSNPRADIHNGDTVACMLGGDRATLKTFYIEADGIRLQPENPAYEPYHLTWQEFAMGDAGMIGVVKGKV